MPASPPAPGGPQGACLFPACCPQSSQTHFQAGAERDGEGRDPKLRLPKASLPANPVWAGRKEGCSARRPGRDHFLTPHPSTFPSPPRAQPWPHGDTSRRRLSSFSLWGQGRRLGAGRLGALRPRPRLRPPGRGGEPRGRGTRSVPKRHRGQNEKMTAARGFSVFLSIISFCY